MKRVGLGSTHAKAKARAVKHDPNTSHKVMNEQNKNDLSKNYEWQQYPLGNTPEENGIPPSGNKLPEEFWKTPQQMQAEQILGQKPPVKIVQKSVKPPKKRTF